jgi:hypothetical protein
LGTDSGGRVAINRSSSCTVVGDVEDDVVDISRRIKGKWYLVMLDDLGNTVDERLRSYLTTVATTVVR